MESINQFEHCAKIKVTTQKLFRAVIIAAMATFIIVGSVGAQVQTGNNQPVTGDRSVAEQQVLDYWLATNKTVFVEGNSDMNSYYMGKYLVTQGLWRAVMGPRNPAPFSFQYNHSSLFRRGTLYHPVENVSWWDAQEFIRRLNTLTGRNYRLPTEAEWEFAARGGNYSRGYEFSGSNNINDVAWYILNSNRRTQPVGSLLPNELGIYDMTGNVWEWTQCRERSNRVVRGGSLVDTAERSIISFRHWQAPEYRFYNVGFRLAHP